jgi:hypothetical protein
MSKDRGHCFTSRYKGKSNVLKNKVKISPAIDDKGQHITDYNKIFSNSQEWEALWDTGATKTLITPKVVQAYNLKVVSKCNMTTPHGTQEANCYYINLLLPNHVIIPNLLAIEGVPTGCDVLVGMDIIGLGDFAVTNYEVTAFSFRLPSKAIIDFVAHTYRVPAKKQPTPGRNDPCPCGSGKKYKFCCGKNTQ